MRLNLLKSAFSLALSLLLIGCSESQKSQSEAEKTAIPQASEIRVVMMQPPRTGLSPLSDDAFKLSRWSTAETLVNLNEQSVT